MQLQRLSEKMRFCASAFRQVVQKHAPVKLGEVGKESIFWLLTFSEAILPKPIKIDSGMSKL